MSEPKPLASLDGHLLARKGTARPAMRQAMQPFVSFEDRTPTNYEDLGWNDMGESQERQPADILPLTPAPINAETKAETRAEDEAASAQLAENARKLATRAHMAHPTKPEVHRQQEAISAKIGGMEHEPDAPDPSEHNGSGHPSAPKIDGDHGVPNKKTAEDGQAIAASTDSEKTPAAPAKKQDRTASDGRRAAFTLRLNSDRHLKLRLACTIRNRSAQQVVTEALDRLLEEMPELESLAAQVKRQ